MPETITADECKAFFVGSVPVCIVHARAGQAVLLVGKSAWEDQDSLERELSMLEAAARHKRQALTKVRHRRKNERG